MTNTKQPLYKQLNELRTQGEWVVIGTSKSLQKLHIGTSNTQIAAIFTSVPDAEANAAYTCLAVNNLHILAGVLNRIVNESQIESLDDTDYWANVSKELINEAKEALNRIY